MKYIPYLAVALAISLSACKSKKVPKELDPVLKRAEKGDANAQYECYLKYRQLPETKENKAEAAKWCIKAAEQGHEGALEVAYDLYDTGFGVPRDSEKTLFWLLKSAEVRQSSTKCRWIAERYVEGKGTPTNPENAVLWYKKALDLNDKEAACRLGELYWNGQGVPRDYAEAVAYFQEAVSTGGEGRYYLAKAYTEGNGVTKDPVVAYAWIKDLYLDREGMTLKNLLENVLTEEQEKEAALMFPKLKETAIKVHQDRVKARSTN
jgi:uncharacterized protein